MIKKPELLAPAGNLEKMKMGRIFEGLLLVVNIVLNGTQVKNLTILLMMQRTMLYYKSIRY